MLRREREGKLGFRVMNVDASLAAWPRKVWRLRKASTESLVSQSTIFLEKQLARFGQGRWVFRLHAFRLRAVCQLFAFFPFAAYVLNLLELKFNFFFFLLFPGERLAMSCEMFIENFLKVHFCSVSRPMKTTADNLYLIKQPKNNSRTESLKRILKKKFRKLGLRC